ncbi:MAG TPA: hypothetical protein VMU10_03065 [Desulfomonilia bacterium]|nr:hypothetical protein [Desulfomonilia bacterium]
MNGYNRFIKTPEELFTIMEAFRMAPDNEISDFIVGQTEKIIELERHIKFQNEVIDAQKKQLERKQFAHCQNGGRHH